jgi:D-amino peptidase
MIEHPQKAPHRRVLIISDIEGSSQCSDYAATKVFGQGWPNACLGMTLDVNAVVTALFNAGVEKVYIKDFHRTGYNLFPSLIDPRARLVSGYEVGPIPGLGSPFDATGLMLLGMHAPSGTNGFLPHTLTSRIVRLEVNGHLLSEAELFAAVLSSWGLSPLFFSGCAVACAHAKKKIPGIQTFASPAVRSPDFKQHLKWRRDLGNQAVRSLAAGTAPFSLNGPFHADVTMRDGNRAARRIARNWGHSRKNNRIYFTADTIEALYLELIKAAFLTPVMTRFLPAALAIYRLIGRTGLKWAGRQIKTHLPAGLS